MKKNFNLPYLAFLAWMAALLCITLLASCGTAMEQCAAYQ